MIQALLNSVAIGLCAVVLINFIRIEYYRYQIKKTKMQLVFYKNKQYLEVAAQSVRHVIVSRATKRLPLEFKWFHDPVVAFLIYRGCKYDVALTNTLLQSGEWESNVAFIQSAAKQDLAAMRIMNYHINRVHKLNMECLK